MVGCAILGCKSRSERKIAGITFHSTAMKMEESRRHKAIQNAAHHIALECIHPQSAHGSPYHVYPYPSPVRLQHAFQSNSQANASPKMFYPKGLRSYLDSRAYSTPSDSPILGRALCLTPRGSPLPGRVTHLSEKFSDSLTLNSDTDLMVAKISAMFPTVSETHIKILLKKYHHREAVVISALQVEKHPITTPGPISMSPSSIRLQKGSSSLIGKASSIHDSSHLTPQTGTPHGSPMFMRPSSGASSYFGTTRSIDGISAKPQSPKMKLKYLKSIFPKAEETLILDILASKDNNVLQASEELLTMGFPKKPPAPLQGQPEMKGKAQPKRVTIPKTTDEKEKLKKSLKKKYNGIAERVVSIALESVDYNEERAEQILSAVLLEGDKNKTTSKASPKSLAVEQPKSALDCSAVPERERDVPAAAAPPQPAPPAATALRRIKQWTSQLKPILKPSRSVGTKYKSNLMTSPVGPNAELHKGPKDSLLLEEYLAWNGPNPVHRAGPRARAETEGGEKKQAHASVARGPAPGLAKGPAALARGSIYKSSANSFASFPSTIFKY